MLIMTILVSVASKHVEADKVLVTFSRWGRFSLLKYQFLLSIPHVTPPRESQGPSNLAGLNIFQVIT